MVNFKHNELTRGIKTIVSYALEGHIIIRLTPLPPDIVHLYTSLAWALTNILLIRLISYEMQIPFSF